MPPPAFIFVRHGQAKHNVAAHGPEGDAAYTNKDYQDAELTEEGLQQARATGEALSKYRVIDIWSSPLSRCIQTASEIFEEVDAQSIYLHDGLLERLGRGHVCNDRKNKWDLKKKFAYCRFENLADMAPVWIGMENNISLTHRMYSVCMLLSFLYKNAPAGSYIVVVSHWGSIMALTGKPLKNAEFVIKTMDELCAGCKVNGDDDATSTNGINDGDSDTDTVNEDVVADEVNSITEND